MTKKSLSHLAEEECIHAICEADACRKEIASSNEFLVLWCHHGDLAAKGVIIVGNVNC